jgi:hypothetical protein
MRPDVAGERVQLAAVCRTFAGDMNMRQTLLVVVTTAVITAIIAIWGTSVIIAHSQKNSEEAAAPIDMERMMQAARRQADENAAPVD